MDVASQISAVISCIVEISASVTSLGLAITLTVTLLLYCPDGIAVLTLAPRARVYWSLALADVELATSVMLIGRAL